MQSFCYCDFIHTLFAILFWSYHIIIPKKTIFVAISVIPKTLITQLSNITYVRTSITMMLPSLTGPLTRVSTILSNTSTMEPKAKSGVAMASAMALHFFGYEFARGSNMALFTSSKFGFANSGSYYPLAMTCVSPVSMILLLSYGRQIRFPRA